MRSNCFPSFFYQNSGSRLGREPFSPKEAPRFEGLLRGGQPEPPAGRSAHRKLGARRRPLTWRALGCGRAGKCAARGHVAGKRQTGSEPGCLGPLLPRGAGVPSHPWTARPASGTRRVGGPGARSAPASCGLTPRHPVHAPQAGPRPSAPLAPQIRYGGRWGVGRAHTAWHDAAAESAQPWPPVLTRSSPAGPEHGHSRSSPTLRRERTRLVSREFRRRPLFL